MSHDELSQAEVDDLLSGGPVNPYEVSGTVPWRQEDYLKYDAYNAGKDIGGGVLQPVDMSQLDGGGGGQITDTAQRLPTMAGAGGGDWLTSASRAMDMASNAASSIFW